MSRSAAAHTQGSTVARTIRFPAALREKVSADAERCGRSFDGQVIALLRRHYGEDVDIAPNPVEILALAAASLADVPDGERLMELRAEVERILGPKFDRQKYHDFLLAQGLLPPALLRQAVYEDFIPKMKG